MNLVDSCGWLEYFADGPNADFYTPALEDPGSLLVSTICLLEVFKRVLQQRGEDAALSRQSRPCTRGCWCLWTPLYPS